MILNDELKSKWEEMAVGYFKTLSLNFFIGTEKNKTNKKTVRVTSVIVEIQTQNIPNAINHEIIDANNLHIGKGESRRSLERFRCKLGDNIKVNLK
jgi:hypothetical protein